MYDVLHLLLTHIQLQRNQYGQDWEEILKGAKSMSYKKDEVLIQEKLEYNNLYQISRGSCRIEKQGMRVSLVIIGIFS